jgi:hypothetical protein
MVATMTDTLTADELESALATEDSRYPHAKHDPVITVRF